MFCFLYEASLENYRLRIHRNELAIMCLYDTDIIYLIIAYILGIIKHSE